TFKIGELHDRHLRSRRRVQGRCVPGLNRCLLSSRGHRDQETHSQQSKFAHSNHILSLQKFVGLPTVLPPPTRNAGESCRRLPERRLGPILSSLPEPSLPHSPNTRGESES